MSIKIIISSKLCSAISSNYPIRKVYRSGRKCLETRKRRRRNWFGQSRWSGSCQCAYYKSYTTENALHGQNENSVTSNITFCLRLLPISVLTLRLLAHSDENHSDEKVFIGFIRRATMRNRADPKLEHEQVFTEESKPETVISRQKCGWQWHSQPTAY